MLLTLAQYESAYVLVVLLPAPDVPTHDTLRVMLPAHEHCAGHVLYVHAYVMALALVVVGVTHCPLEHVPLWLLHVVPSGRLRL